MSTIDPGRHGGDPGVTSGALSAAALDALRELDTATAYNLLKGLGRGARDGYSGPGLRSLFPSGGTIVGYAVTSAWTAGEADSPNLDYLAYLELLESAPRPCIAVLADVGRDPGRSGIAGDGMMREFQVLGAAAAIVGGSVMDVAGIERLGLPVFATGVVPAYDDLRMASFGEAVDLGPLRVATGDLLLADRAGVVRIPADAVDAMLAGLPGFRALEASVTRMLDVPGQTAAGMRAWYAANEPAFLGGDEPSSDTLKRVMGEG